MKLHRGWRWVIGITLLALIISRADLRQIFGVFSEARAGWLMLSVLAFGLSHLALAEALYWCLGGLEVPVERRVLIATHFESIFIGTFLPSSLGVDVVKAVDLGRRTRRPGLVAMGIGIQRIIAFALVLAVLLVALPSAVTFDLRLPEFLFGQHGATLVAASALLVLLAGGALARYGESIRTRVHRGFEETRKALGRLRRQGAVAVVLLQASVLALNILGCFLAAEGLEIGLGWRHFCYLMPATYLAVALPITISGLGVREGVFVALLGLQRVPMEQAVGLSLLLLGINLLYSLVGSLVHVLRRGRIPVIGEQRE